jgi:ribosomal protein S18 acetylase RimI-like enzyme
VSTTEIEIRLLSRSDADVLLRADADVFDFPVRRDYAEAFLAEPNSLIAVALDRGTIVGMASAFTYRHPDKPLQLFINEVGVAPDHRRRGIAKKLVARLLFAARELGCAEAWVATEAENAPARALYQALEGEEDESRAVVYTYDLSGSDSR